MSLADIQICYYKVNTDLKVIHPGISTLTELFYKEDVLKTLYPRGICIQADEFMPYPASPGIAQKLIESGDVYLSGSFETNDLGLSTSFMQNIPTGVRLIVCYDGIYDTGIIKAHLMKAIDKLIKSIDSMKVNEYPNLQNVDNAVSDNVASQKNSDQLLLSVLCPESFERECITNFIDDTFHGNINHDVYPALALYETQYE